MPYTIFAQDSNLSRLVRAHNGAVRVGAIDLTVIPGANATQSSPATIFINAGDLLYKTTAGIASLNTAGTNKANTAAFCGIAETGYPIRTEGGLYKNEPNPTTTPPGVSFRRTGDFRLRTTVGNVYAPGVDVYLGEDAQTVTTVATNNGTKVGRVAEDQQVLPGRPKLGSSITGVAGTRGTPGAEVVIEIVSVV